MRGGDCNQIPRVVIHYIDGKTQGTLTYTIITYLAQTIQLVSTILFTTSDYTLFVCFKNGMEAYRSTVSGFKEVVVSFNDA